VLQPDEIAPDVPRPIRRAEYERLVAEGAFEDEKVELLEGVIVTMSPQGPDHADLVGVLMERLIKMLGDRATVRVQSSFAASTISEPEPDISVVPRARYRRAHPERAFLIVEVARTSRRKDREVKARVYAQAAVEEYWVVDLVDEAIVVYRRPEGGSYRDVTTHGRGRAVAVQRFSDVVVSVDELFG